MSMQHDVFIPQFGMGDRIGLALRHAGHGISETAEYFGVHRHTVGRWINGHVSPTLIQLRAIAMYTGVTVEWLKTGKEPDPDGGPGSALPHLDSNQEPCDFPSHTYLPRAA